MDSVRRGLVPGVPGRVLVQRGPGAARRRPATRPLRAPRSTPWASASSQFRWPGKGMNAGKDWWAETERSGCGVESQPVVQRPWSASSMPAAKPDAPDRIFELPKLGTILTGRLGTHLHHAWIYPGIANLHAPLPFAQKGVLVTGGPPPPLWSRQDRWMGPIRRAGAACR